jgi:hypothetical protein
MKSRREKRTLFLINKLVDEPEVSGAKIEDAQRPL